MANKHTKKALLMSMLSILLCLSMLVGSTFAWFTDTASTGVNTIVAGNLDVELEYSTDLNTWNSVEGKTDLFKKETLWEPGHTEVAYLRVRNAGSLAVDYALYAYAAAETTGISVLNDAEFKLSDVLEFAVVESNTAPTAYTRDTALTAAASAGSYTLGNKFEDTEVKSGEITYYTMIVYMPTGIGNAANHKTGTNPPSIDLKITLEAIQATVEEDSFGNDYDETANGTPDHPEFGQTPPTVETKQDVLPTVVSGEGANKTEVVKVPEGEAAPVVNAGGLTVTYGDGVKLDTTAAGTGSKEDGSNTADAKQGMTYDGTKSDFSVVINEEDQILSVYDLVLPVAQDNTIPVKVVKNIGADKGIAGVNHNGTALKKAASADLPENHGMTGNDGYFHYNVTSGDLTLWVLHASEIAVIETPNYYGWYEGQTEYVINDYYGLVGLAKLVNEGKDPFSKKTVTLGADIDLENKEWTPIGKSGSAFRGIFDGQNHTISNLKISGNNNNVGLFGYTTDGEVKNLTVNNATVRGYLNVAVVAGTPYTSKYTNIKVTGDVKVDGYSYVGGVGGKNAYASFTNITINVNEGSYVRCESEIYRSYVGGVIGFAAEGNIVHTNLVSNIDVYGSTCDVGGITGIAHYNNKYVNCSSSGNVYLTAYPDDGDQLEMGGIAGVWHNQKNTTVTFENCSFTGTLTATKADGTVYEGQFENNGLVGKAYSSTGTGELIIK